MAGEKEKKKEKFPANEGQEETVEIKHLQVRIA